MWTIDASIGLDIQILTIVCTLQALVRVRAYIALVLSIPTLLAFLQVVVEVVAIGASVAQIWACT
jgi:hypothetical protein